MNKGHFCSIPLFASAPSAVKQPNVNIVYGAQSQDSIQLQADVTGNGIRFVEWKFNGTGIRQVDGITDLMTNQVSTGLIAILTVSSYDPVVHLGTYELLVTSQAGTASVASWLLRNAGINIIIGRGSRELENKLWFCFWYETIIVPRVLIL